jgi:hypothetical protein
MRAGGRSYFISADTLAGRRDLSPRPARGGRVAACRGVAPAGGNAKSAERAAAADGLVEFSGDVFDTLGGRGERRGDRRLCGLAAIRRAYPRIL